MRCERIRDQDALRTPDDDSTMQRTQILPLDEISHSTAKGPAVAAMAAMAAMAVMAAVLSPTGIRDYGNRTIRRQDTFGTSTDSSLARVWVNIVSTPSEDIVSPPSEELGSTPSEEFGSTSASLGCVRSDFVTGQPVSSQSDRHTVWFG